MIILDAIAAVFFEHVIAHLADPSTAAGFMHLIFARVQPAGRKLTAVGISVIPEMSGSIRVILVQVLHARVRNGRSEGKTQPNPAGVLSRGWGLCVGEVPGESSHRPAAVLAVPNQRLYPLQEGHTQLSVAFSLYRNPCGFLQRPTTVAGLVTFYRRFQLRPKREPCLACGDYTFRLPTHPLVLAPTDD